MFDNITAEVECSQRSLLPSDRDAASSDGKTQREVFSAEHKYSQKVFHPFETQAVDDLAELHLKRGLRQRSQMTERFAEEQRLQTRCKHFCRLVSCRGTYNHGASFAICCVGCDLLHF